MPNISAAKLLGYGPIALSMMCLAMAFNYSIVFGAGSADMNKSGVHFVLAALVALQIPMILAYVFMDLNEEYKVKMRVLMIQGGAFFLASVSAMSIIFR